MSRKVDKLVAAMDQAVSKALFLGDLNLTDAESDELYAKMANRLAFHAGDFIGMLTQDVDAAQEPLTKAAAVMRKQALVYTE